MELDLHREILSALEYIFAGKREVKLHNDHKGMPVSFPAVILGFKDTGVVFKTNKYQLACLALEKHTFIQSDLLPSIVKARLIDMDFSHAEVILQNFSYTVSTIGKREFIRVQPPESIQAVLDHQAHKIKARVIDISEGGLGLVTTGGNIYSPGLLRRGSSVMVVLRLPGESAETFLAGAIRNLAKGGEPGSYRLGIQNSPNSQAREAIARFISARKTKILAELDSLYTQLSK